LPSLASPLWDTSAVLSENGLPGMLLHLLHNGFLLTVLLMVIIPLWRVIMMSVTPIGNPDNGSFGMWINPSLWSFEAFQQLLTHPNFVRSLGNSVFIALVGKTAGVAQ
jgi:ABC-type glycerol-3-phosphate transport system permease component